ncbi:hypothetical protein GS436_05060 [Rhodococcus hoagii]|nr:hypothetical protein [Prescottella equi]
MAAAHNEAIISIYPRPGVNQRFLGYFLSQYNYEDLQDRQIKGNTLNKSKLDRIRVPAPSEPEQCAIADVLDGLRRAISLQDIVLSNVDRTKSAAMHQLFSRGCGGRRRRPARSARSPKVGPWTRLTSISRSSPAVRRREVILRTGPVARSVGQDNRGELLRHHCDRRTHHACWTRRIGSKDAPGRHAAYGHVRSRRHPREGRDSGHRSVM